MNTELIIAAFQRTLHKQLVDELEKWLPSSLTKISIKSHEDSEPYRKLVSLLLVADGLQNDVQGKPRAEITDFSAFAELLADKLEAGEEDDALMNQLLQMAKNALTLIENNIEFSPEILELTKLAKEFFDLE